MCVYCQPEDHNRDRYYLINTDDVKAYITVDGKLAVKTPLHERAMVDINCCPICKRDLRS